MPEGPEVRLTVDFLNKALCNKTITKWNFCGGKYTEIPPEGYKEFDSLLPAKIEEIKCKGKFIYFLLNSKKGKSYIFHSLMLTGSWRHNYDNYCKAFIEIDTGKCIWFRDTRGFGFFSFMNTSEQLTKKLERLGPDIMSREFTIGFFKEIYVHS
jgi:formamidopyrimidine-DNA glycosylase